MIIFKMAPTGNLRENSLAGGGGPAERRRVLFAATSPPSAHPELLNP